MPRTHAADVVHRPEEIVTLRGWVDARREHGKLTFFDLRDHTGIVQCVGRGGQAGPLRNEDVVEVVGKVSRRPAKMENPQLATGLYEIAVETVTVLNHCGNLPLPIDTPGHEISEELRLRYRYLDLRRPRMQRNIRARSALTHQLRTILHELAYVEIETPLLTQSTKEGARDFVVPSRHQPGKFYALPQSPQQYKQLLMAAGFEKYFQIARCIRDEDLRADRGFEFTQLDIEKAFVTTEADVLDEVEVVVRRATLACGGRLRAETFPVLTYAEAMEKYGCDKPDLRTGEEKQSGALAFAWVVNFPLFKAVNPKNAIEVEEGKSGWTFMHNPFSIPVPEHRDWLLSGQNVGQIIASQYDLVCNGLEIGSGSIRAHTRELLMATFRAMGYTAEETNESVGHMLEAFGLGTPPHGGIALGIDRLAMLLCGESSLKEVVAFPMTGKGRTAVMGAPTPIAPEHLRNCISASAQDRQAPRNN